MKMTRLVRDTVEKGDLLLKTNREIRAIVDEGVYREFKALCARRGRAVKEVLGFLMEEELIREETARQASARTLLEKFRPKPGPSKNGG